LENYRLSENINHLSAVRHVHEFRHLHCSLITNIICVHHHPNSFSKKIEEILLKINKWFQANSLILNLNKTKFIHFSTKLNLGTSICIDYEHNHIENSQSTSFLGLILDRTLSWHFHINKICAKLQSACYILRTLKPVLSVNNLKMIYFS
jgi:hypothetical protein